MTKINLFEEFFKRIRVRLLYQNKNWLAIITGDTGSGKSYSALSIAKKISNNIHVVFNPVDFLKVLNSGKVKKGSVIIFDEAGVGLSSREWYSVQNKLLGTVLQTFRNMNLAVIFTTPDLSFVDVQARKLFHHYFETRYINYEQERALLKVFNIDPNGRTGKIWYQHPIIKKNGMAHKLKGIQVRKPDEKTIKYYEGLKEEYTKKLNKDALDELTGKKLDPREQREEDKKKKLASAIEQVKKNPDKYIKEYLGKRFIDKEMVKVEFDLSHPHAKYLKSVVENEVL